MKGGFHLPVLKYDQGAAGAAHDLGPRWHLRSELCVRQTPTAGDRGARRLWCHDLSSRQAGSGCLSYSAFEKPLVVVSGLFLVFGP